MLVSSEWERNIDFSWRIKTIITFDMFIFAALSICYEAQTPLSPYKE